MNWLDKGNRLIYPLKIKGSTRNRIMQFPTGRKASKTMHKTGQFVVNCPVRSNYLIGKSMDLKSMVLKWAVPCICFIVGAALGPGALWQLFDYRIKSNTASREQIKLEKDYYARLYRIQNEVSSELIKYIELRDRHFANHQDYQAQNEFLVLMTKLAASIEQYNRLEVKLAMLERREVKWFVVPLPPLIPTNIRIEILEGKPFLVSDPAIPDPLQAKVSEDMKAIIENYGGQPTPSDKAEPGGSP
jgi:hypothetical protein